MRIALAALTWIASTAILAPVLFFAVIFLAGPHSSVLPSTIQPAVLITGLATLIAVPIWLTRKVFRGRR